MIHIRKANIKDIEQMAYVHITAWKQTYQGLIHERFIQQRSIENSIKLFSRIYESNYVALDNNDVIGFASYGKALESDYPNCGEIKAIYLLEQYHHRGIGMRLMDTCLNELAQYASVVVWVLDTNTHAIAFYQRCGFVLDGKSKTEILITPIQEVRMVFHRQPL